VPETALVTPDAVEDLLVDVIRRRHPEHLAKLERERGLDPETLERYRTVSHMAAEGTDARLSGDVLPACLLGVIGTAGEPTMTEDNRLNVALQLGMQVSVLGQRRRDTLRRRDWTAWTTIECVLQRVPRSGPVASIRLTDYEPVEQTDEQRVLAEARVVFTVTVADMLAVIGGLPVDTTPWPPGGPLGPPATPYEPPAPAPDVAEVTYTIDKEPIVE
jgi:hypothetical protein